MPNAAILCDLAHQNYLILQRVWKCTRTRDFELAVERSTHEERMQIRALIVRGDNDALRRRVREILNSDLECKTVTELRQIGRAYQVKYWNNISKSSLIAGIKKRMADVDKQNNNPEQHKILSTGDENPSNSSGVSG